MSRASGFSLIELMVVVVVIGILSAIAFPSYRAYAARADRTAAKAALVEAAARQESALLDRKSYATKLSKLSYPTDTPYLLRDGTLAASSANAIYRLNLAGNPTSAACPPGGSATGTGWTLLAEPQNARVGDRCGTLCLSSLGTKTSSSGTDCWKR